MNTPKQLERVHRDWWIFMFNIVSVQNKEREYVYKITFRLLWITWSIAIVSEYLSVIHSSGISPIQSFKNKFRKKGNSNV